MTDHPLPGAILRIDASMRRQGSVTRALADRLVAGLSAAAPAASVVRRDLAEAPVPFVDELWVNAKATPAAEFTEAHRQSMALSDTLIEELRAADLLVLASPIYNFGPPAALKAWIDQVARAGETFRYTPDGPVGLLTGKRAILLTASGGTTVDSPIDFSTPYLRHALKFIGIEDVTVIAADGLGRDGGNRAAAEAAIDAEIARLHAAS